MHFSESLTAKTKHYLENHEGRSFSDAEIQDYLKRLASYGRLIVKIRLEVQAHGKTRTDEAQGDPSINECAEKPRPTQEQAEANLKEQSLEKKSCVQSQSVGRPESVRHLKPG